MATVTSNGVKISAEVFYQESNSNPAKNKFIFAYRISIENLNDFPVQIQARHWDIWESTSVKRVVDGEGVVGEQPAIQPGHTYDYTSWSHMTTVIGAMSGHYQVLNVVTGVPFLAQIPKFFLVVPFKMN